MDSNSYLELSLKLQMVPLSLYPVKSLILLMVQGCLRAKLWTPLTVPDFCPQVSCDLFSGGTLDTGHFFNTSLIQCLVFKGIVKGPESKIWAFFKGLRSFRGPQKQE